MGCPLYDCIIWFPSQFNSTVKKPTICSWACGTLCQNHELNLSYEMSRHGWSLDRVYLELPKFSFWVGGGFWRTLCVRKISCWWSPQESILHWWEMNTTTLDVFPALCNTSCFLKQNPWSSGLIFLTSRSNQATMETGENNKLLYSAEQMTDFWKSLSVPAESVPR